MSTTDNSSPSPAAAQAVDAGGAISPHTTSRLWKVTLPGYLAALAAVAIDQLSKVWAEANLAMGERHPLLGDMLALQLTYNPGAAFSLGASATPLVTVLAAAGTMFAAWLAWRTTSLPWALSLGLILGGALGNVIDRLARHPGPGRGHVMDFIAYADWFIGNLADVSVFGGLALCIAFAFMGKPMRPQPSARRCGALGHKSSLR